MACLSTFFPSPAKHFTAVPLVSRLETVGGGGYRPAKSYFYSPEEKERRKKNSVEMGNGVSKAQERGRAKRNIIQVIIFCIVIKLKHM